MSRRQAARDRERKEEQARRAKLNAERNARIEAERKERIRLKKEEKAKRLGDNAGKKKKKKNAFTSSRRAPPKSSVPQMKLSDTVRCVREISIECVASVFENINRVLLYLVYQSSVAESINDCVAIRRLRHRPTHDPPTCYEKLNSRCALEHQTGTLRCKTIRRFQKEKERIEETELGSRFRWFRRRGTSSDEENTP